MLALCFIRKIVLEKIFTIFELRVLDNVLPPSEKQKRKMAEKMRTEANIGVREKEVSIT